MQSQSAFDYLAWKGWRHTDFGTTSAFDAFYYNAEVKRAMNGVVIGMRILDVGFGNGAFIGWAALLGNQCSGVEIDPELRCRAIDAGIPAYGSIDDPALLSQRETFDLVAAFDVLEHIEESEVEPFMRTLRTLLKEGGRLLARFPNGDSPFGRYCQYGDYTHVTTLSSGKLIHLAKVCDFSVVFIGAPSNPIWRGKLRSAVKRLAMAGLRALVDRILRLAYFNGYPVCLDENLLVVLERKLTRPELTATRPEPGQSPPASQVRPARS